MPKKTKTGILLIDLCKRPDTFTRSLGLGYKVPFRNCLKLDLNTKKKNGMSHDQEVLVHIFLQSHDMMKVLKKIKHYLRSFFLSLYILSMKLSDQM